MPLRNGGVITASLSRQSDIAIQFLQQTPGVRGEKQGTYFSVLRDPALYNGILLMQSR